MSQTGKFYYVCCLDTDESYPFYARAPYEAMTKMQYTLNLKRNDPNAVINKTKSGLHLYMEHSGKFYAIRNKL